MRETKCARQNAQDKMRKTLPRFETYNDQIKNAHNKLSNNKRQTLDLHAFTNDRTMATNRRQSTILPQNHEMTRIATHTLHAEHTFSASNASDQRMEAGCKISHFDPEQAGFLRICPELLFHCFHNFKQKQHSLGRAPRGRIYYGRGARGRDFAAFA